MSHSDFGTVMVKTVALKTVALEVAPYCAAEDMGDEIVALNVDTGVYFSMRDLGGALWRDLAAGFPVAELARRVGEATGTEAPVHAFVEQMLQHGLMRDADPRPVGTEPSIAAVLKSGKRDIDLEVFDDMKDLILSDPIHDVDENVGWPKPLSPLS